MTHVIVLINVINIYLFENFGNCVKTDYQIIISNNDT